MLPTTVYIPKVVMHECFSFVVDPSEIEEYVTRTLYAEQYAVVESVKLIQKLNQTKNEVYYGAIVKVKQWFNNEYVDKLGEDISNGVSHKFYNYGNIFWHINEFKENQATTKTLNPAEELELLKKRIQDLEAENLTEKMRNIENERQNELLTQKVATMSLLKGEVAGYIVRINDYEAEIALLNNIIKTQKETIVKLSNV